MKAIRTNGKHQVVSHNLVQFQACQEDGITAEVTGKGDAAWVNFYNKSGKLCWSCNHIYFKYHFEYVDERREESKS